MSRKAPRPASATIQRELAFLRALQARTSHPWLDQAMKAVSLAGKPPAYLLGLLGMAPWHGSLAIRMAVVLLVSELLNYGLKQLCRSGRPGAYDQRILVKVREGGYGLPSAHSQNAMALAPMLAAIPALAATPSPGVTLAFSLLAVAWVLVTAFSRLYLGVHLVRDVALGVLLGGLLSGAAVAMAG